MHEAIIVANYMVCEKTPSGNVPTYNNANKFIRTITGESELDCINKVNEFLQENEFKLLQRQEKK